MKEQETTRTAALALLAVMVLVPVTLPVSVLKAFVQDRFEVSAFLAHLFMSVNMIGAALMAPLAGAVSDRWGRRKLVVCASLVIDAILLWALTLPVPFEIFLGIRFLEGAAHISALSMLMSLAAEVQVPERRGKVMGLLGGAITLGVAIGAPLGGRLGDRDPLLPLYVASAISLAAAALSFFALIESRVRSARPRWREIFDLVARDRALLVPLAFAFADRFTVGFFTTTFPLYLASVHRFEPSRTGMLLACFLVPFALLSYPFGRLSMRVSRTLLVCGGSFLYGAGTASLGWWPACSLAWLMVALGVLSAVMFVPSLVMATDFAEPRVKGTVLGGFNAAGSLGFILGPVAGGAVFAAVAARAGDIAGYRSAFVVAGFSEVLCVMVTLPVLVRLVRARRTS